MPDRTYSEREIAAILARAATDAGSPPRDGGPGLTLAEIEQAAAGSGIDPAAVRRAAGDLDAGRLALGAPGTTVAERWVDAPLRLDAWEDAVAALRVRYGESTPTGFGPAPPDLARVGEGHEWTHRGATGLLLTVTVSPRGERTRVRVVQTEGGLADLRLQSAGIAAVASFAVAMLAGAGVAETLGWGDLAGVLTVLGVLVLGVALATPPLTRRAERTRARRAAEAERLADELAWSLGRAAEPTRAPADTPLADAPFADAPLDEGRIDPALLALPDAPDPPSRSSRLRERG